MYRLWGIIRKNNKIIEDMVVEIDSDTIPEKDWLEKSIENICYAFDLEQPFLLPKNIREYEKYRRIILRQDNFIDTIDFDALELEVLEEPS